MIKLVLDTGMKSLQHLGVHQFLQPMRPECPQHDCEHSRQAANHQKIVLLHNLRPMDTHVKRQLYRIILKLMAWLGIFLLLGVFLRSCFA